MEVETLSTNRRWFVTVTVAVIAVLLSTGCGGNKPKSDTPARGTEGTSAGETHRLIKERPETQVFAIDTADGQHTGYLIRVFDNEKKVIYEARRPKVVNYEPDTKIVDDDIVEIRQGGGTGYWLSYYYDRKNNRVSPVYQSPLLTGYGKIVVPKTGKLAVADIFDKNAYYKEILISDYPRIANPVDAFKEIKWVNGNKLSVTYLISKEDGKYIPKTVIINLNE